MTDLADRRRLHVVPPDQPLRRFASRRFVIGAVVAAVVLVLLAWALALGGSPHRSPTRPSSPTPVAVPRATPPRRLTCPHLATADQKIPTSAPAGVTWAIFDTIAVPSSPTAGPAIIRGGVARCFSRTPAGAVLAAVQIATRVLVASDWRTVLAEQVVPGTGTKVYALDRAKVGGPYTPGEFCQVAGFSVLSWTRLASSIELVDRCGANLEASTLNVVWSGVDWRLVLLPDGSQTPTITVIDSLTGFVPFGGV